VDGASDLNLPLEQLEEEFIIFINGFLFSPWSGATDSNLPLEQLEDEFIIFINGFLFSPRRG
jgi:hypothetical protein